jgi:type VI secretion system protein ImpJ
MYLGPHQFQVQNRYFEDSLRFATSSLWFEPYGLIGCEMDTEALINGVVSIIHARGILPDGLAFHMPDSDSLPEPRNISELFPVARDTVTVMLAIPPRRRNGLNCAAGAENTAKVRFVARTAMQFDENTGLDEQPVRMGHKNVRLILDTEETGDLVTLPVARVMRDGAGSFAYDPNFIPPCLELAASDRILALLGRLIEILEEKSKALGVGRQAGARSWSEYSTRDIANFWMLHSVHAALAPLRHLFISKRKHPEELYVELARLGGALCTFVMDSHPTSLPLYDHRNLDKCFESMDTHIRMHLNTIVPTNCISIPLVQRADFFYEAQVIDQRCLDNAKWVFAISSSVGEVDVIQKTPSQVKVCSKQYLPKLVERALGGMTLTHMSVPPSAISTRVDMQYFSINRAGPCWENIVSSRQIGIYVPGVLPNPKLELLVVLES